MSLEWKREGMMDGEIGDERDDGLWDKMRVIGTHDEQIGEVVRKLTPEMQGDA